MPALRRQRRLLRQREQPVASERRLPARLPFSIPKDQNDQGPRHPGHMGGDTLGCRVGCSGVQIYIMINSKISMESLDVGLEPDVRVGDARLRLVRRDEVPDDRFRSIPTCARTARQP